MSYIFSKFTNRVSSIGNDNGKMKQLWTVPLPNYGKPGKLYGKLRKTRKTTENTENYGKPGKLLKTWKTTENPENYGKPRVFRIGILGFSVFFRVFRFFFRSSLYRYSGFSVVFRVFRTWILGFP